MPDFVLHDVHALAPRKNAAVVLFCSWCVTLTGGSSILCYDTKEGRVKNQLAAVLIVTVSGRILPDAT